MPPTGTCYTRFYDKKGDPYPDGNCVTLNYCDGASFSGFMANPVEVPPAPGVPANTSLYFRGLRNLDATLDYLFAHHGLVCPLFLTPKTLFL